MAITRAQQAKQLLALGGRTGFRIGSGEGKDVSGREYGGTSGTSGSGDGRDPTKQFTTTKTPNGIWWY